MDNDRQLDASAKALDRKGISVAELDPRRPRPVVVELFSQHVNGSWT